MKKFILILGLLSLLSANVLANNITFLHPIFYQQLSSQNGDYFYVLKPNTMYYENSKTGTIISTKCFLQENKEDFIKLLCDNCEDSKYITSTKYIHTFALFPKRKADNNYVISHKIYDKSNNLKSEEVLINDGLIAIPPYQ